MLAYTNEAQVALAVALYLATDNYDQVPGVISATALMRPTRQLVLTPRVPKADRLPDVMNLVKSRMGSSIHDGIERAWTDIDLRASGLKALGYPQDIIDRIVVNPEELKEGDIPVYMELRSFREINGRTISGKFDFVAEGLVRDFKSTGTYTWEKGVKWDDYKLQLSIYRWLNPEIVTQDTGAVHFFFTDWVQYKSKQPTYPSNPVMSKDIPLMTLDETSAYINSKLDAFDLYKDADESTIPLCTDKELWRKPDVWKVYKDPMNQKRAMNGGTFDNPAEANQFLQDKTGGSGIVIHIPGQVTACKYCDAFLACSQKDGLIADGSLVFDS